uniref:Uncharacterized protein n=1 Tax=Tetradesmus obliquus TaxID=3088 RepID=A0A383VQX3_TETOB|eukprot:jgi/Sobl393_1/14718/SZX67134.1
MQVQQGQHQQLPAPTFIQDLAASIGSFTELLNSLKAQQRQQYASLLQQEQQLLDELGTLQLCVESIDESSSQTAAGSYLGGSASCSYNSGNDDGCLQDSFSSAACREDSPSKLRGQRSAGGSVSKSSTSINSMSRTRPSTATATVSNAQYVPGSTNSRRSSSNNSSRTSLAPAAGSGRDSSSSGSCSSTLLPEVVAYDEFVAQHGATGGWHPDDHKTFVALLRRSRGDYSAALAPIVDALPGKSRQAVITHSRWHADLTELDMRRRVALVNWRTARDAAKAARQAEAATLQDAQATLQAQLQAPDQLDKEVRALQKQAVAQWKAERAAQEAQQQWLEEERQRWQRQQQAEQLQRKRAELKQQIEVAKAAKQQAAAAAATQAGYQARAGQLTAVQQQQQQAQALAEQRVAQRNAAAMARKQQLLAAKEEKLAAREKAQQQLLEQLQDAATPKAARDPGRLLSGTAAAAARAATAAAEAEERQRQAEGTAAGRGSMGGGFVLHLGHKAVPAWASGMRL